MNWAIEPMMIGYGLQAAFFVACIPLVSRTAQELIRGHSCRSKLDSLARAGDGVTAGPAGIEANPGPVVDALRRAKHKLDMASYERLRDEILVAANQIHAKETSMAAMIGTASYKLGLTCSIIGIGLALSQFASTTSVRSLMAPVGFALGTTAVGATVNLIAEQVGALLERDTEKWQVTGLAVLGALLDAHVKRDLRHFDRALRPVNAECAAASAPSGRTFNGSSAEDSNLPGEKCSSPLGKLSQ